MNFGFSKKIIYIASGVIVVGLILLIWLITRSFVSFEISPNDATLTIDNVPVTIDASGKGKTSVKPGKHTVSVSREQYITAIFEINLSRASNNKYNTSLKEVPRPVEMSASEEKIADAQFLAIGDQDNSIFYLANGGTVLYKALLSKGEVGTNFSKNSRISYPPLSDIKEIIWGPKRGDTLLRRSDGIYYFDFKKYNLVTQELVKFGDDIGNIAWAPDDSKIAYYFAPVSGEKSLIFTDKTNKEMERVLNFKELDIENPFLSWSNDSRYLLIVPRNKDLTTNKIYKFDAYSRKLEQISEGQGNFEAYFSPDDSKILYSVYSKDPATPVRTVFSIMDSDGQNQRNLELRAQNPIWISNNTIVAQGYDAEKRQQSIFAYNTDDKKMTDFSFTIEKNVWAKDLIYEKSLNAVFYISADQIFSFTLK